MSVNIKDRLIKICSAEKVIDEPEILKEYSKDLSLFPTKEPQLVVYPKNTKQVQEIVKVANEYNISIIPISSPNKLRFHGDTIPKTDNSIIMDLSKIKEVLKVDLKNRVIMVEPGVTYGELINVAKKNGLRLNGPLYPRASKSVLASALEREPPTIPRYQWDSSDPLLCTEVIFGTGDYFRTGIAAGPGSIEQQLESGQAQKNPMGPTQFSPFRLIQGAQGTLGVVTWATIKCEFLQDKEKLFFSQSDNLIDFFEFMNHILKYRLVDNLLIVNKINLAALLGVKNTDLKEIKEWILITNITGREQFAQDRIDYIIADLNDILDNFNIELLEKLGKIENQDIDNILHGTCEKPWQLSYKGGFQDIFYITTLEQTLDHYKMVKDLTNLEVGVYIQPIMQGCAVHCEFNLFYDPSKVGNEDIKTDFLKISNSLMKKGAFFNRPYGLWASDVYSMVSDETVDTLRKVKAIFDPKNVMNRGALCFTEE